MPYAQTTPSDLHTPLRLYYERAGSGRTVLFISGTGADLRVKPNVFDSALAARFDVLAYDQRGLGRSDAPPRDYSMAGYAEDAAGLLDRLDLDQVCVVGVSFGGMVAQELALRYPQRVTQLALVCTSSGGRGGASYPLHELAQLPPAAQRERHLELADVRRDARWRSENPQQWQRLLELAANARRDDANVDGAARQLAARAGHDTADRLAQLDLPVLIMAGRYDGIAPPDNQRFLAGTIPGAVLRWYEGGHLFLVQDKTAYPDLCQWLAGEPLPG